jgi:hypothetical protein
MPRVAKSCTFDVSKYPPARTFPIGLPARSRNVSPISAGSSVPVPPLKPR